MITIQPTPQSTVDPERIKRAKKNRELQLNRWEDYEKSLGSFERAVNPKIYFQKDIVLLEAVSRNDLVEVENLLKKGYDSNACNVDGLTGLHQCCIDDYVEMAQLLLKYNANPNKPDSEYWTPLHAAATCGRSEIVLILAQYKANFLAINADGNMPYDICDGEACLATIEMEMSNRGITQEDIDHARSIPDTKMLNDAKDLIKSGQFNMLEKLDAQGANMLHISSSLGFSEVVRFLLQNHVDASIPDSEGWQSIHIAACWNHLDIVEMLVGFGADIDATTKLGESVFDISESESHTKLMYIKDNAENIRRDFHPRKTSELRSFRKNRGSSIRRTSMKQKNQMARKEAKEEFLTMTTAVMQTPTSNAPANQSNSTALTVSPIKTNIKLNRQTDQNELNSNKSNPTKINTNQSKSTKPNSIINNSTNKVNQNQPKLMENRKKAYMIEDTVDEDSDCDMTMTDEIVITIGSNRNKNNTNKTNITNNNNKIVNDKETSKNKTYNNNVKTTTSVTTTTNNNNKTHNNKNDEEKPVAAVVSKESNKDSFVRNNSSKRKPNHINPTQNSQNLDPTTLTNTYPPDRVNVYSSNVANWDPSTIEKRYSKNRRNKGCCQIL